jgi:hypothetical protein
VEELAQFARLKREQPLPFARLCVRYGALVAAVKLDAASAQAALERASKEEVVELFIELALSADLNAVEIDKLRRLVTEKFDVGLQPLKDLLKQAQAEQAKQRAKQERARRLAARTDPRPMVRVPADSAPFLPEMAKVNAVLKFSQQTVPPGRDIDRFATRLRKLSVPKMHAFGQTQSNPPGDDDHD